jgi:MGT family glycosyltransferase
MRILVAAWDSGGGVEAVRTVVARAIAEGHDVRVLGTEGLRTRFESTGATFRTYRYAPDNDTSHPETDLAKDWEAKTPLGLFARIRDRVLFGPALAFSRDVIEELEHTPADLVAVDVLIASAVTGAEAAGVSRVVIMHGPCMLPRTGQPMIGTGFRPAHGPLGRARDRLGTAVIERVLRTGLPPLNEARAQLGLPPSSGLFDLIESVQSILVCTSPSYDLDAKGVPNNVRYVGPQLEDQPEVDWEPPWGTDDPRPIVLVGLSGTYMRQEQLLERSVAALGELPVRGVVTTGTTVDPATVSAPENVLVVESARHADLLPKCSAVITHGGHGTVLKSLTAGVPLVIAPLGRDQPDNAMRVELAGAGIRVSRKASVRKLRTAVSRVLDDERYRSGAQAMAKTLAAERDEQLVVRELERAGAP